MLKTYDPKNITMIFAGIIISGLAEDEFVNAARMEDSFTMFAGADGEVTRAASRNKTGEVTFTVQQSADCNALLSALHALDEASGNGIGALIIKDIGGTTLLTAEKAWIVKPPDVAFGREVATREWKLHCAELIMLVGGN